MNRSTRTPLLAMHRVTAKSLLLAAVFCGLSLTANAQNTYWDQYGSKPVLMQQENNGSKQTLKFVAFRDGMLVAELDGGIGEASLPITESMANTLRLTVNTKKANDMLSRDNFTGALNYLRPEVYPLIKFHQVPDILVQLHGPLRLLIDTLVDAGELQEAEDIINRIKLDKVGIKYSESAIRLIKAYIASEEFNSVTRMANMLPVDGDYAPNITAVLKTADALRGAEKYEAVIPLYRGIESAVTGKQRINVQMWLAYSLVLSDRLDEATPILEKIEEPAPSDRLFSLYKLLEGSKAYRQQEYKVALDLLTRGFVRAQTSYDWVPEMLYLIGDCYIRSEDSTAARNVWTEIAILYPDSPWASRAQEALDKLPKA